MKIIFFAAIRRAVPKRRSLASVGIATSSHYTLLAGGPHD
jgi:hypothetical protein